MVGAISQTRALLGGSMPQARQISCSNAVSPGSSRIRRRSRGCFSGAPHARTMPILRQAGGDAEPGADHKPKRCSRTPSHVVPVQLALRGASAAGAPGSRTHLSRTLSWMSSETRRHSNEGALGIWGVLVLSRDPGASLFSSGERTPSSSCLGTRNEHVNEQMLQ